MDKNNQLITIKYDEERQTVLARDLHEFLDVGTEFRHWFPRMCEYGFTEDIDYTPFIFDHPLNHQPTKDYQLTIEMAKEISMLQRTEKGKTARQYFIELEKKWNSPEAVMARALTLANKTIEKLKSNIEESKPLVLFAETALKSKDNILVRQLAKIAQDEGLDIGEKKLYNKLRYWKMIMPSSTEPYQSAMNSGYFVVEENNIDTPYGVKLSRTTKVTPKGQIYIIEKLKKEVI